jgi:hypothetical protein
MRWAVLEIKRGTTLHLSRYASAIGIEAGMTAGAAFLRAASSSDCAYRHDLAVHQQVTDDGSRRSGARPVRE